MTTLSTFPSLIPVFQREWSINNSQAGTISGLFFAGEMLGVTVLTAMTDRVNAKPIFVFSLLLGFLAGIGFALTASDVWSAGLWRFLQGLALGGTYMPGLKILTDHLPQTHRSRGTSLYTATYYLAAAISYLLALEMEPVAGWEWTYVAASAGPLLAAALSIFCIPSTPAPHIRPDTRLFDYRPILKNRRAVGFAILYGLHNMELIAFSSWLVPFLVFSNSVQATGTMGTDWSLGTIAALVSVVALPASVTINEVAQRVGRQRVIIIAMILSAIVGVSFASLSTGPYLLVVGMAFVFSMTIAGDSSTISAGVIHVAEPRYKGTTMSFYSVIGFLGGAMGPIILGGVLDLGGGEHSKTAWIMAFGTIAALTLIGPIVVARLVGFERLDS